MLKVPYSISGLSEPLFKALIYIIFLLSGASSLIYQVAWQRAFTLYYGLGSVSVSIVVSIFLLGLGFGSLLGGWLIERLKFRVLAYFAVEMTIGVCGLFSPYIFTKFAPVLADISLLHGSVIISLLLLFPTLLMGMTLPIVLKIFNQVNKDTGSSLSLLYFVNTLGAAIGAFVCSYILISLFGIEDTIRVSAITNFALAFLIVLVLPLNIWAKRRVSIKHIGGQQREDERVGFKTTWHNYAAVFVSGFLAIGYQLIWFRVLTVLLKPSAYVFSSVLSIYLLGIAIGSYWMSRKLHKLKINGQHKQVFLRLNSYISLITFSSFLALYWGADSLPLAWMVDTTFSQQLHPPYHPFYALKGDTLIDYWTSVYLAFDIFIWPLLLILPTTILMGASFPLISVMAIESSRREAWRVSTVYGVNITGNVLGGLITGFIFLPLIGTELTLSLFCIVGVFWILGLTDFLSINLENLRVRIIFICVASLLILTLLPNQKQLYLAMHSEGGYPERNVSEGIDGVVVSYTNQEENLKAASIFINGAPHARFPAAVYRLEVMEAIKRSKSIENVLVIGFGGGDLTNTLLMLPEVKNITVVEISDTLIKNLNQINFYDEILNHPKLKLIVDDGRRFLHTTDQKFDLIMMDPLRSTTAYSNNIYSQEFFQLVKSRLHNHGVLMAWMNEYRIIPNTLASVFEHMHCFYFFCLNSPQAFTINQDRADYLWTQFNDTIKTGINRRRNLAHYFKGDRDKILELGGNGQVNSDLNPRTEYYIGYNLKRYFNLSW